MMTNNPLVQLKRQHPNCVVAPELDGRTGGVYLVVTNREGGIVLIRKIYQMARSPKLLRMVRQ